MSALPGPAAARSAWLSGLVLSLVAVAMLRFSWLTWPDALIDFGREVYVAWRLAEGDRLYQDVAYLNGPVSPHWNALLFRIFGAHLDVLFAANFAVLAAVVALLARLLARVSGTFAATAACALVLVLCGFGQLISVGNYNFIAPYSHELTHGLLVWLAVVALADRFATRSDARSACALGVACGISFLTKPEIALACAASAGVSLVCAVSARSRISRVLPALCAGVAAPVALAFAALWLRMPASVAARGVLGAWPASLGGEVARLPFYLRSLGLDAPGDALERIALSSLLVAGILAGAAGAALALRSERLAALERGGPPVLAVLAEVLAGAIAFAALTLGSDALAWHRALAPLPVAVAVIAAVAFWHLRSATPESPTAARAQLSLVFAAGALALLAKVALNARIYHYGFALSLPALALCAVALVHTVPAAIAARGGTGGLFRGVALGALVAFAGLQLGVMAGHRDARRFEVGADRDRILSTKRDAGPIQDVLGQLRSRMEPGDRLAVLPEGALFHFWLRRPSSSPHINFMPPELAIYGEDAMRESLARDLPEWIVLVHKDTAEYGPGLRFFGKDHAQSFDALLQRAYTRVGRSGDEPFQPESRFGIVLLKRRAEVPAHGSAPHRKGSGRSAVDRAR